MSKILIVDDEAQVNESIREILTVFGHKAISATNGKSAIEIHKKERPDIILLDLCFPEPEMGGVEILKAIRELDKDVKVVLTSGLDVEGGRLKEAQELGINKYLPKPLNIGKLKEIIDELTK